MSLYSNINPMCVNPAENRDQLTCGICFQAPVNVMTCQNNKHVFCQGCIDQNQQCGRSGCCLCTTGNFFVGWPVQDNFIVYCHLRGDRSAPCSWTGPYKDLAKHLAVDCQSALHLCGIMGCSRAFRRDGLNAHHVVCEHRIHSCRNAQYGCQTNLKGLVNEVKHSKKCGFTKVHCPNPQCDELLLKKDVEEHLAHHCLPSKELYDIVASTIVNKLSSTTLIMSAVTSLNMCKYCTQKNKRQESLYHHIFEHTNMAWQHISEATKYSYDGEPKFKYKAVPYVHNLL